jgi:hypothetical protein
LWKGCRPIPKSLGGDRKIRFSGFIGRDGFADDLIAANDQNGLSVVVPDGKQCRQDREMVMFHSVVWILGSQAPQMTGRLIARPQSHHDAFPNVFPQSTGPTGHFPRIIFSAAKVLTDESADP